MNGTPLRTRDVNAPVSEKKAWMATYTYTPNTPLRPLDEHPPKTPLAALPLVPLTRLMSPPLQAHHVPKWWNVADVTLAIVDFLPWKSLIACAHTCRELRMNLSGDEVLWNAFGETGGGLQQFCARWKHVDRSNAEADSDARASNSTIAARKEAGVQSALAKARQDRATRFGHGIAEPPPVHVEATPVHVEVLPETADPVALKARLAQAKEELYTLCEGGMAQTNSKTRIGGKKYWYACTDRKHTGCPASGTVEPDWTVSVTAKHTPGCRFRGNVKGLQPSEKAVLMKSDTTANPSTAKAAQDAILRHRDEATRVKREKGEPVEAYALPIPSVRQCRYYNNSVYEKPTCNPDDVESIEDLLNRYHGDLHRGSQNPPPREVVVVKIEQWYTPAKERKSKRVKSEAPQTRAKEPEPELNSIIILSTPALMELCKAHKGASIDGTYRCAPGKSTICDFGVFVGRTFVPCFLGIMSGERSGDSSDHYTRYLQAVHAALGGHWEPETCVRDHAAALINALYAVWPRCLQIVCYFHLKQCIRRQKNRIAGLDQPRLYKEIMRTIDMLHYTSGDSYLLVLKVLWSKLPPAFRVYFFNTTHHGTGSFNEVWTFNLLKAGEPCTNSSTESFHHRLRVEHMKEYRPSFTVCLGKLQNVLEYIDTRVKVPSKYGPLLYCEESDRLGVARVRRAWKGANALVTAGVLASTWKTHGGTVFYFKAGGLAVQRGEVDALVARRYETPAQYAKFWLLRKATEHECTCHLFLKFSYCRHCFAVKIQLHGYRDVCPTALQDRGQASDDRAYDSGEETEEEDVKETDDADLPDNESGDEEEDIAPLPAHRSRRLAVIHNVSAW